ILHVTNKGLGKRSRETEYRKTNRGGKGYYVCRITEDTGDVVQVKIVNGHEDLMLITVAGVLIRIPVSGIPITGRSTQGVSHVRLHGEEVVANLAKMMLRVEQVVDVCSQAGESDS